MDIDLRIKITKELEIIKYNILDFIENNNYTICKEIKPISSYFNTKGVKIETINNIFGFDLIIEYDSALTNIMNFVYIPLIKSGKIYLYVVFDEVNGDDESLENTLISIPVINENQLNKENEVITESALKEKLYPIYIMVSFTKTSFGNLIKKVTHSKYTHSAISLDSSMKKMYSFNLIDGQSGFSIEDINKYNHEDDSCITYINTLFIKLKDLLKIREILDWYILNREKTRYSFINCFGILINKAIELNNRMICSQFVDFILKSIGADITGKKSPLVTPNDFTKIQNPNVYKVYEGPISKYNPKKVDMIVNKIEKTAQPIVESSTNISENNVESNDINIIDATHYADYEWEENKFSENKKSLHEILDNFDIYNNFDFYKNKFNGIKKLTVEDLYNIYGTSNFNEINKCIRILYNLPFKNIQVFDRDFSINPEVLLFDNVTDCNKIFYLVNKFGETYKLSIYMNKLYLLFGCGKDIFGIIFLTKFATIPTQINYLCNPKKGDIINFIKDFTHFSKVDRKYLIEGNFEIKFLDNEGIEEDINNCENDIINNIENKNIDGLKNDICCITLISNRLLNLYNQEPSDYALSLKERLKRMYQKCNMTINNLSRYNNTPFNGINYISNNEYSETINSLLENNIQDIIKWLLIK